LISALWNMAAQRLPRHAYRDRYEEQRARRARRPVRSWVTVGFAGAVLLAAVTGTLIAVFAWPDKTAPVPAATVAPPVVEGPAR
jgi:hypothetical protein